MGRDWRWWFRRHCMAIAGTESFDDDHVWEDGIRSDGGIRVVLCRRWRWHRGTCARSRCSDSAPGQDVAS